MKKLTQQELQIFSMKPNDCIVVMNLPKMYKTGMHYVQNVLNWH